MYFAVCKWLLYCDFYNDQITNWIFRRKERVEF